jgi:hypothetical protein
MVAIHSHQMDNQALLALFDKELRIEIEHPGMVKERLPQIVRFSRPAPGANFVLYSRLDESNADRIIEEQIARFGLLGQPFHWDLFDHDPPADLRDRLVAHGFAPQNRDAVMALDLQAAPPALLAPVTADVRRLTERSQLSEVVQIEEQVWGGTFGWITNRLGEHMALPGYLSVYVAYHDGRPGCAAWIYFHQGSHFASLWGGATVPDLRRHGLYTAVLACRAQEAIRRGFRFLTIDASAMSGPIVARHGFTVLTHIEGFVWRGMAGGSAVRAPEAES